MRTHFIDILHKDLYISLSLSLSLFVLLPLPILPILRLFCVCLSLSLCMPITYCAFLSVHLRIYLFESPNFLFVSSLSVFVQLCFYPIVPSSVSTYLPLRCGVGESAH